MELDRGKFEVKTSFPYLISLHMKSPDFLHIILLKENVFYQESTAHENLNIIESSLDYTFSFFQIIEIFFTPKF